MLAGQEPGYRAFIAGRSGIFALQCLHQLRGYGSCSFWRSSTVFGLLAGRSRGVQRSPRTVTPTLLLTNGLLKLKENYASARVDHHFSEKDSLSGSWLFDRGPYTQPDALLDITSSLFSFRQMYGIEETHVFSPSFVNTARFGFNRSHGINGGVVGANVPVAGDTSLGVRPGIPAPIISISGLTATSSVGSASQNLLVSNSFQFYDDAFLTKGTHSLKFGLAVERIQFNLATLQRPNGQFTFGNFGQFLSDGRYRCPGLRI